MGWIRERVHEIRWRRHRRRIALVSVACLFLACDDDSFGPDLGETVGPEFEGLLLEVVGPATANSSEEVRFEIRLTNLRTSPYIAEDPQFDVYVLTGRGLVLWNWLYHNAFVGPWTLEIQPGETFDFSAEWNLRSNRMNDVPSGSYAYFAVYDPSLPSPNFVSETHAIRVAE